MSDSMRWYVVHTYSGYENKVATNIEKAVENRKFHDLIGEVKVPTETVTEIKDNKKRDVERKIFPGYVLVKMIMTDESWYAVRNIRGPKKRSRGWASRSATSRSTSRSAIRSGWRTVTSKASSAWSMRSTFRTRWCGCPSR